MSSLAAAAPGALVDRLAIEPIRRRLASEAVGQHIYLFDHLASTADVLERLAGAGAREGTVVASEDGPEIRASVLLRPVEPLRALPPLSAAVARALAEALHATAQDRVPRAGCSAIADRAGWVIVSVVAHLGATSANAPQDIVDRSSFVAGLLNALDRLYAAYTRGGQAAVLVR